MNLYRTYPTRLMIGLTTVFSCVHGSVAQQPAPAASHGPLPATPQAATAPAVPPSTVDVRTFGAKGDGTTDDTAAFLAALAAVAAKGGVVSVPVGDYLIKTHLEIPANVALEGVWKSP